MGPVRSRAGPFLLRAQRLAAIVVVIAFTWYCEKAVKAVVRLF